MITLKNVDKYFFRHKKNEIHVIDHTSLELDKTGLVALLGPSGSGKTTLLNAIGGLDKVSTGEIFINGQKMSRMNSYKRDKIRVLNIGYIFQNYNLLDNLTVFENVALSLKMIGIKNRFEIKKRVDYVLEAVGMYRYRNKLAGNLSGGQRQRVGIARAIVKNPQVIIADEPTGNLDSKNTLEIMNIIKSISKDRLVILVTHEKDLAHFYASRIISLEDGKITDDAENIHDNELDYRIDNKIYLGDFKKTSNLQGGANKITVYSDEKEDLVLDIALKNGNVYIRTQDKRKIEVVDENSGIEFVEGKYKKISRDDYEKSTFDIKNLDNSKHKLRYTSIYNLGSMFVSGFKKVMNYTLVKKILLLGFLVSSMFIVYSVSSIFGITRIEDKDFIRVDKNYILISSKSDISKYNELEQTPGVEYIMPGDSVVNMSIENESLFQLKGIKGYMGGSLIDASKLSNDLLSYGVVPTSSSEVVIDELVIDHAKRENDEIQALNLPDYESYIGFNLSVGDMKFKIVGISKTETPSIYVNKDRFIDIIKLSKDSDDDNATNSPTVKRYDYEKDEIKLKRGRVPKNDYEVIVNITNSEAMPLNRTIDTKIGDKKLKVVGYYSSTDNRNDYYTTENTYKNYAIMKNENITLYSEDKEAMISTLQEAGYNAKDTYQDSKDEYIKSVKDSIINSLIISGILLAISFVEIFLMIRASFLSRIKEVGIYRAIGVKKTDIYKMFLGETLIITTFASLPGAILMCLIMNELTKISFFEGNYAMNIVVVITSLILIYGLNMLIGLLPIKSTIRKTPAEILSRNDVD